MDGARGARSTARTRSTPWRARRATLCIAVDNTGRRLTSVDGGTTWSVGDARWVDGPRLNAISCPTATFCAAVDNSGNVLIVEHADDVPVDRKTSLTSASLTSISCASSAVCVAANDANGTVFATGNASAALADVVLDAARPDAARR